MEIKTFGLVKDGKRQVKVCNAIRTQMYERIADILADEGFEVVNAANGDLAIATAYDAESGNMFYTRLSVSFTDKPLDSKLVKKVKEKAEEPEIPYLFAE